jgi:hypothetical protein
MHEAITCFMFCNCNKHVHITCNKKVLSKSVCRKTFLLLTNPCCFLTVRGRKSIRSVCWQTCGLFIVFFVSLPPIGRFIPATA